MRPPTSWLPTSSNERQATDGVIVANLGSGIGWPSPGAVLRGRNQTVWFALVTRHLALFSPCELFYLGDVVAVVICDMHYELFQ
jgi:hypothetical protein